MYIRSFERHVRSVESSASQRIGILRRARNIFDSAEVMQHCFRSFMLPIWEYASVPWCSAAVSHLAMLDRIVNRCSQLMDDVVPYCLDNRRSVLGFVCCIRFVIESVTLCFLAFLFPFSVIDLRDALRLFMSLLWSLFVIGRTSMLVHSCSFMSFIPAFVDMWNDLDNSVFAGVGLSSFKTLVNRFLYR